MRQSNKLDLLVFLFEKAGHKAGKTPFLSRRNIASEMSIPANTVKVSIRRLVHEGFLQIDSWDHSCKQGGAYYVVTKGAEKQLLTRTHELNEAKDSGTEASVVVVDIKESSKPTTTTQTQHALGERLKLLATRLDLQRLKVGARDLAESFRKSGLDLDMFEISVEHATFHALGEGGVGLTNPGRWIIQRISAGYEHEPAGFESWVERQERIKLEDVYRRKQRLEILQRQRFQAEFEEHLLTLSTGDKQQLLRSCADGKFFAERPDSSVATGQLRRLFAETTERLHLLNDGETESAD